MDTKLPVIMSDIVLLPFSLEKLEIKDEILKGLFARIAPQTSFIILDKMNCINVKKQFGMIVKVEQKIELPNGNYKLVVCGQQRILIDDLVKIDDFWQASYQILEEPILQEEEFLCQKLKRELINYIKNIPYVSNSILSQLDDIDSLSKLTDVIGVFLLENHDNLKSLVSLIDPEERMIELLKVMNREKDMFQLEKEIDLKVRKQMDENQREYVLREKIKVIQDDLGEVDFKQKEIEKLKNVIYNLKAPQAILSRLKQELKRYESLSYTSPEQNVVYQYIEHLIALPWNKYQLENDDLLDVRKILDDTHYGLDTAKERMIEYLAVKKLTNRLTAPIICLVGPPGVGKTSFAESLAKAMHRDFVKMSVGGMNDASELIGHRRTYLGASPGRIIQGLQKVHSMNPVFLIDEIDKITKNYKGDPASTLLEILDPVQNKHFSDHYIEEEVDLSTVFFITTANSLESIPQALLDRLEIISLSGYTELEKIDIAKNYLIPKVCLEHGINTKRVDFQLEAIIAIIRGYTKEAGVRDLERKIATIIRKLVTKMVMEHHVKRMIKINKKDVNSYLKQEIYERTTIVQKNIVGIANALAYTPYGGEVLNIEANHFPGTGQLILTGSLGEVMKESAQIALDYIKANQLKYHLEDVVWNNEDIHIHIPDGAIPKDGPSAGIALVTVLLSLFTNKPIDSTIAFTGEITLQGNVLAIGGVKEKIIGAAREGIRQVFIPKMNKKEIEEEVPAELKEIIKFNYVNKYDDIWKKIGGKYDR